MSLLYKRIAELAPTDMEVFGRRGTETVQMTKLSAELQLSRHQMTNPIA